jgi:hypothetical protein
VSTRVMDACWGMQLDPSVKAVLMSLADQANDEGVCWPGVGSLALRTCLSERTVQRSVRTLEGLKLLSCEMGAARNGQNRYTLNVALLRELDRQREAAKGEAAGMRQAALELAAPRQGVTGGDTVSPRHHVTPGDTVSPGGCHGVTQTVIEPIPIHTPHTPQPPAGGLKAPDGAAGGQSLLSLPDWLQQVQASGQDAVPEGDEVWDYAAAVGLPREFVELCWREFKRRQMQAGKRRRDWRAHFRECVRGGWYGLWLLSAGQDARLSTAGEQATRFYEAQDRDGDDAGGGE